MHLMPSISARAVAMIEEFEVGGAQNYQPHPAWPGGASGVTIGVGYDLGYAVPDQIAKDWYALPDAARCRLQSYAGRTGAAAASLLPGARDIEIPRPIAFQVFEERDIPRNCLLTSQTFLHCDELSADSFGALVSLVFNRGTAMTDTQPNANRLEMRQIRDAMAASDFQLIPGFIRAMKRLWQGQRLAGLLVRRDTEAGLFEAGLIQTPR